MKLKIMLIGYALFSLNAPAQTWQNMAGPYAGIIRAIIKDSHDRVYAGSGLNGILMNDTSNSVWYRIDEATINPDFTCFAFNSSNLYAGSSIGLRKYNNLAEKIDTLLGMLDYSMIPSLLQRRISDIVIFNKQEKYVATNFGIYKCTDLQDSVWTESNNGLTNTMVNSIEIIDSTTILAGTFSGIFKSTNSGLSWENISSKQLSFKHITCIKRGNSASEIYVGTRTDGLYRSSDNGRNWMAISQNDVPDISAIAVTDNGTVYVSSYNQGVFVFQPQGNSLSARNEGLTNMNIYSLYSANNILYAGTLGSGVFNLFLK